MRAMPHIIIRLIVVVDKVKARNQSSGKLGVVEFDTRINDCYHDRL